MGVSDCPFHDVPQILLGYLNGVFFLRKGGIKSPCEIPVYLEVNNNYDSVIILDLSLLSLLFIFIVHNSFLHTNSSSASIFFTATIYIIDHIIVYPFHYTVSNI